MGLTEAPHVIAIWTLESDPNLVDRELLPEVDDIGVEPRRRGRVGEHVSIRSRSVIHGA